MNTVFSSIQPVPCTRRQFIGRFATIALCAATSPGLLSQDANRSPALKAIPVGSNIYGWSQYYQRDGKDMNAHLDEVLSALRDAGYDYLEGFMDANHPESISSLAERMRAKGLKPVCLYSGGRLHEAGKAEENVNKLAAAAEIARKEGFTVIDCNPDPIGREKTDDELAVQAKALDRLGAGLRQLGLKFGIHNHTPEMANGAREFHHIFTHSKPENVGFCYDVDWVNRGGIRPADCLKQYGSRIVSWHLRQTRNGIWWEDLDSGDIDYEAVARFARENKLEAPLTIELALENGTKITRSAVENHRRSREFVRRVFGV